MAIDTFDQLNGLFQKVYGKMENLVPDHVFLAKKIPFVEQKKRVGESYNQAIIVKSEHGATYGGSTGEGFSFNDPIPGAVKQATVSPAEFVLRAQVARAALSRSENNAASFMNATKHVVDNMLQSMFTKYEAQCFYGGVGLATVGSVNTSTGVITVTTAEWAPALWVGAEGMKVDIYDSTSTSAHESGVEITAVDLVNRRITVSDASSVVAGDVIYEKGAKGNEFIGIHKMITATTGNIFGQSVATYSLWRGNTFAVGGAALTFAKISEGIAQAVAKGVKGVLTLLVNPATWSDLLTEQVAQRQFHEGGMSEYSNGAEAIKFYCVNGTVEILANPFVKEGYAYGLDLKSFLRIGSKDISFDNPVEPGKFIMPLEGTNAYQILGYTDSALFCSSLGKNIVFSGIQN